MQVGLIGFWFYKRCFDLIYKMGPKKGRRNVRRMEVPTNIPTEVELGDAAAHIERRGRRENTDGEEEEDGSVA